VSPGASAGGLKRRAADLAQLALLVAALAWLVLHGTRGLGYNWQWYRISPYIVRIVDGALIWGPLMRGLMVTLEISAAGLVLTLAIGLAAALLRSSRSIAGRMLASLYVEIVRNTPLLVQLYLFYFVLAPILGIPRFWTGVLCLAVFEGSFATEIFRAGIQSVPRGQWEASDSLGIGPYVRFRHVILPQAVQLMLPPLTGQAVSLIKDSSIVSVIAIFDLTNEGRTIISDTFMSFEIWFTVAAIYLVLTVSLSAVASRLERRAARHRRA
jgi:polar amino acid transport system permease protein